MSRPRPVGAPPASPLRGPEFNRVCDALTLEGASIAAIALATGRNPSIIKRRRRELEGQNGADRRAEVRRLAVEGLEVDEICARVPGFARQQVVAMRNNFRRKAFTADYKQPDEDFDAEAAAAACDLHLADLEREHVKGAGEIDIPPGYARPLSHYAPPLSLGGSPAGACADAGELINGS